MTTDQTKSTEDMAESTEITVKEKAPRDRRFFKAVCNYMSNVLKMDAEAIRKIIGEKVESMGVEALVERHVKRYFGFGPDAHSADSWFRARIDKVVDGYIKDAMEHGMKEWMDVQIQHRMDQIAGCAAKPAAKTVNRPGLTSYAGAMALNKSLINCCIGDWLEASMPESERKAVYTLDLESKASPCVMLQRIGNEGMDALNALRKAPGRYDHLFMETSMDCYMLCRLLETQLGLPARSIKKLVPVPEGAIALLDRPIDKAETEAPEKQWAIVEHWNIIEVYTEKGTRYLGHDRNGDTLVEDSGSANRYLVFADAMQRAQEVGIRLHCNALPKRLTVGWNIDDSPEMQKG